MPSRNLIEIRPHAGPQESFLMSAADVCLYGGAAGSGKSWALLLDPLRHVHNPRFGATIYRRTHPRVMMQGGLWDQAVRLYPLLGATPNRSSLTWQFPSGARVQFAHLQHEDTVMNYMGSELVGIYFDELIEFAERQFWLLFSRNRSTSGIRPFIRGTCNPDADSWVAELLAWWINQETGLPIPERAGVLRYFVRDGERLAWSDSEEESRRRYPDLPPKSLSFVPAKLSDNPTLLAADRNYLANLLALPLVERERLLAGNWKVRPAAGLVFNRAWFQLVPAAPAQASRVRYWDKAGTEGAGDWSVGVRMSRTPEGLYVVEDVIRGRWSSGQRNAVIRQAAAADGPSCAVWVEQEPGSGGKESAEISVRELAGYNVHAERVTGDKLARVQSFSAQCEAGNVRLVAGPWNACFLEELHGFTGAQGGRDDQVDAAGGAFRKLVLSVVQFGATPAPEESLADQGDAAGVWGSSGSGMPGHF